MYEYMFGRRLLTYAINFQDAEKLSGTYDRRRAQELLQDHVICCSGR